MNNANITQEDAMKALDRIHNAATMSPLLIAKQLNILRRYIQQPRARQKSSKQNPA